MTPYTRSKSAPSASNKRMASSAKKIQAQKARNLQDEDQNTKRPSNINVPQIASAVDSLGPADNNQPNDGNKPSDGTLEAFVNGTSLKDKPEELTLSIVYERLETNTKLFGSVEATEKLKSLQFNTEGHEKSKSGLLQRLFAILSIHPDFAGLTEEIDDPDMPGTKTRRFFVFLRGVRTPLKMKVLNYALLLFSQRLTLKKYQDQDMTNPETFAKAQYQTTTMEVMMKTLFSAFSAEGITFRFKKDFNGPGHFNAYWKNRMQTPKSTAQTWERSQWHPSLILLFVRNVMKLSRKASLIRSTIMTITPGSCGRKLPSVGAREARKK